MKFRFKLLLIIISVSLLSLGSNLALAVKAPDFTLPGADKEIKLSKYKNKVVYVDFWASWCIPCKQSFPWMSQMQSRYRDQGFEIIAINLDDNRAAANEFLSQLSPEFTIAYDPQGAVAQLYELSVMPTSFLLDRKGELSYVHRGFKGSDRDEMEARIKELVSKKK